MENSVYTLIDTDHFEAVLDSSYNQISIGLAIGPSSFTGEKINNMMVYIDFLFWALELEFRWETNGEK